MTSFPYLQEAAEGIRVAVHIVPGSATNTIVGMIGDESTGYALKIKIAAVAEDGKANQALLKFLAKTFHIAPSDCSIINGLTSRRKLVLIRCNAQAIKQLLGKL